jgi:diguanylate cyclase (GGDEF)-like protein
MTETLPDAHANASRVVDHLVRLSSIRDRDALLLSVTKALAETICARTVEIYGLVLNEDQRFWLPLTQASPGSEVSLLSDPLRTELNTMAPIESAPDRVRCVDLGAMTVTELSAPDVGVLTRFPVMLAARTLAWGVVEIYSDTALDSVDVMAATRLLSVYANMLDMLDYSECDALTGLWNRKSFEDLFYKTMPTAELAGLVPVTEEHRLAPTADGFWLAMVDIDHFKLVNDRFGHLIGDEVLLLVARLLKASFRAHDHVYRFGGEEFVVVLRCSDHDGAVAAVERFRVAMAGYDFPQAGTITASVGVTEIFGGDSPTAACERADQAVYYAKHNGRNQVCSEADLMRRGLLMADVKVGLIELF